MCFVLMIKKNKCIYRQNIEKYQSYFNNKYINNKKNKGQIEGKNKF